MNEEESFSLFIVVGQHVDNFLLLVILELEISCFIFLIFVATMNEYR